MAFLKWPDKDPDEVLDYVIDWTERLGDDEIVSSTWIIAPVTTSPLTKDSDASTLTSTTIWLSGGLLAVAPAATTKYTLTNRVVTGDGRTMDQSVTLKIKVK